MPDVATALLLILWLCSDGSPIDANRRCLDGLHPVETSISILQIKDTKQAIIEIKRFDKIIFTLRPDGKIENTLKLMLWQWLFGLQSRQHMKRLVLRFQK